MKISAVNTRPDFVRDYWRHEVKLDGEVVQDCIFADSEKGEVVCLVCDENGIKQRNVLPGELPGPVTVVMKGAVTIQKVSAPVTERYSRHYLNIFGDHHHIVSTQ